MVKITVLFAVGLAILIIIAGVGLCSILTTQVSRQSDHVRKVQEQIKQDGQRRESPRTERR